jgi:hypothetical protein
MAEVKEELKQGLTKRVLILGLVVGGLSGLLMGIHQVMGSWWLQPLFFPGPWFLWVIVVQFVIPKLVNKRWGLTKQEWVVYIILVGAVAGSGALRFGGAWSWMPTWHMLMPLYARMVPPYSTAFSPHIPTWLVPPADSPAMKAIYYGLEPGQAIEWGTWIPLILWSTVFFYLWAGMAAFWMFLASRPLITVEKLPFPDSLPYLIIFDKIGFELQEDKKFPLFDFSRSIVKFFWIGFLVGFAYKFLDVLNWIIPAIPPTGYVGVYTFDLSPITSKILPGMFSSYTFAPAVYMILFSLTNLDFMLSVIVTEIVFTIILPVLWVALGLVPYTPGVTESSSYWDFGTTYGPFKWTVWNRVGLSTGMGLWIIISNRDWFKKIFSSLFKADLAKQDVEGLPYPFLAIGAIVLPVLTIIFFTIMGVPLLVSIFMIILWLLVSLGDVRILADMPEFDIAQFYCNPLWESFGVWTGSLPATLPSTDKATVMTHFMGQSLGSGGPRISGFAMSWGSPMWKLAYELKVRAKDVFIALGIGILVVGLASHVFEIWLLHHFGQFVWGNSVGYYIWALGGAQRFTLTVPRDYGNPDRWIETWGLMIFGIIFTYIVYMIRLYVPTLSWLNIAGISVGLAFPNYVFLNVIPIFLIKYLTIKIGGTNAWENVVFPACIGFMIGSGILYNLIIGIALFFTRSIPNFITNYKG